MLPLHAVSDRVPTGDKQRNTSVLSISCHLKFVGPASRPFSSQTSMFPRTVFDVKVARETRQGEERFSGGQVQVVGPTAQQRSTIRDIR